MRPSPYSHSTSEAEVGILGLYVQPSSFCVRAVGPPLAWRVRSHGATEILWSWAVGNHWLGGWIFFWIVAGKATFDGATPPRVLISLPASPCPHPPCQPPYEVAGQITNLEKKSK